MDWRGKTLAVLIVVAMALAPSAKADSFIYDVQSTFVSLHVTFTLPTFEQTVVNQTTFDFATYNLGSITAFSLSGGSAGCSGPNFSLPTGPCWDANNGSTAEAATPISPAFAGPGVFTQTDGVISTTVTITDVPTVPEPATIALMGVGAVFTAFKRRKRGISQ